VRQRARPMTPDERREQLVDVTLELLRIHGRAVTTRQIADRAGVAEGTIFRVVETKEELVDAAIARAFRPGSLEERVREIDQALPLEQRLVALVAIMQQRFRATFDLMRKVGLVRPPDHVHEGEEAVAIREAINILLTGVVGDDAGALDVPVDEFLHQLRLLTFAGSHPHIADGHLLSPEQIVSTLLHGLLKRND